jgi:hypothetical protein
MMAGPNVRISKASADLPHYETASAGDPRHPGRLISCSMVYPAQAGKAFVQYCYVSFDWGRGWQRTLEVSEGGLASDPAVVYGPGDDVYVVTAVVKDFAEPRSVNPYAPRWEQNTVVYKSTDGGGTWSQSSRFPFIDRDCIAIDNTNGKYGGRLYVAGQGGVRSIAGSEGNASVQLFRSLDAGKTFLGPVHAEYPEGMGIAGVGTCTVLSDGTFVVLFGMTKKGRQQVLEQDPSLGPNGELHIISSADGGETFSNSTKIADWTVDASRSRGGIIGQLAVDPGSKEFKDRLYAAFPIIVSDRIQIQLAHSGDKGRTWSKPITVNDDRSPAQSGNGPDHLLPAVAVNNDGVVLVTWYDRREAGDNLGWKLRAAASLDGGETVSASIPVATAANSYPRNLAWFIRAGDTSNDGAEIRALRVGIDQFFTAGGDISGLAVDADGTFYPTWIDNRTSVAQLWTAPVKVLGKAVRHGAVDLARLDDVSGLVMLQLGAPIFDRTRGALSVTAQIKNVSAEKIKVPVKVRVITLESEIGLPEITNADNGQLGTGAVWDFSSEIVGGSLATMALSAPRTLTFRLSELYPVGQGRDFKSNLLDLDGRVLGKLQQKEDDEDGGNKGMK